MKILLVLIVALFAIGYCEKGSSAYDAERCFDYWTTVNRNVLG